MDKIKELTKQKGLLERLVNNTSDEAELKKIGKEIDALNDEIMEAKADAKAEEKAAKIIEAKEKELEEKQVKEAKENKKSYVDIKITEAGEYKGVNLKRAVGLARMKNPIIDARANVNYADTEKVAKYMVDMVNSAMSNPSNKAMTEGTTTAGGYITPTEESMEMLHYVRESSVALQDATIIPMTTDTMTWPIENQKVSVSFRDEGSAVTAQSATFTQASLSTKNLDAYVPASKELVQDSPNLIAILMAQFGESVAKKVDSAAFVGTGSPVSGIFTAATGYSEVFSTGSSNFSALLSSNIDALIGKVFATVQDTSKLKFYVHPSVAYRYFLSLKDDNGQYLYMRSQDGVGADKIWNYPVRFVYQAPSTTAAATGMFAFGDLSGLLIGERLNAMQLFYDPYTDAANGNDRFYWWTRWAFDYALPNKMGRAVTAS